MRTRNCVWIDSGEFRETCSDLIDLVIRRLQALGVTLGASSSVGSRMVPAGCAPCYPASAAMAAITRSTWSGETK